jgi:hypothetical protein
MNARTINLSYFNFKLAKRSLVINWVHRTHLLLSSHCAHDSKTDFFMSLCNCLLIGMFLDAASKFAISWDGKLS